jgi:hypothetical protein
LPEVLEPRGGYNMSQLRSLVEDEITSRIDPHAWNLAQQYEAEERALLLRVAAGGLST